MAATTTIRLGEHRGLVEAAAAARGCTVGEFVKREAVLAAVRLVGEDGGGVSSLPPGGRAGGGAGPPAAGFGPLVDRVVPVAGSVSLALRACRLGLVRVEGRVVRDPQRLVTGAERVEVDG